ncbi:armadillo-type protein [Crepidotus variabilis]|uniref:Armadillo-type protein n=1 Tax=Crepidotus variabilis TaxID=179855 RepID=A0A9P6JW57_9AGAR|nr:armadillo-type protein [Crepidotus variabilis]
MDLGANRSRPMGGQIQIVNPTEVYEVILGACSADLTILQASSKRLKFLVEMFGTFDALQEIASRQDLPLAVRQQAIIQFKNSVLNHWRSRKLLNDEHRARIRQRCLSFLEEPDQTIAEFNEIVVSKISRTDYPTQWPNLIIDLVQVIDKSLQNRYISLQEDPLDTLRLRRCLQLLNGILKEFGGIKLPTGMKTMAEMVTKLKMLLYNYYSKMSATFSAASLTLQNIGTQTAHENIALSHLVYKCLMKIGVWLWGKLEKLSPQEVEENMPWLEELVQNSATQVRSLWVLRKSVLLPLVANKSSMDDATRQTILVLTKHLRVFGKLFRRLQQLSIDRFTNLAISTELVLFYWGEIVDSTNYSESVISDSDDAAFPVRFLVQGLVLFKDNLSQWTPVKRSGMPNKNVLSEIFVRDAVKVLVTRFMPLKPTDLESWLTDPEDWVNLEDKESDHWEYEIRPCAERVLTQLCNQFPDFVVPLLRDSYNGVSGRLPTNLDEILLKEALYCALGRCARRAKSEVNFLEAISTTFTPEVRESSANFAIIKRRVAWLLGKLVAEECVMPNNTQIWDILAHLLIQGTDTAVRLTASAALRETVDSLGFDAKLFAPYLSSTIPPLIQLMGEADTLESKRKVNLTLNTVIERAGGLILPFVAAITAPIPTIWESAQQDLLLKGTLLDTVTKVVESVKENSLSLTGLVVPLVRESLTPPNISHLDVDGLSLWLAALRNTPNISPPDSSPSLRELFPYAIELLSINLDLLGSVIDILESYYLLDAVYILQTHGPALFAAYLASFNQKAPMTNVRQTIQSLSLLVQLAPSELWGNPFQTSGLFLYCLKTLLAEECDSQISVECIYLFSRVLLSNRQLFLYLMSTAAAPLNHSEGNLLEILMGVWWEKFDHMGEPRYRKLTALGTALLVSTGHPEILKKLSTEIFNLWLDVFGELREAQERHEQQDVRSASPTSLVRFWELDDAPDSYYHGTEGTPEYMRRKALYDQDPVRTAPLVTFIGSHLREAEAVVGPADFQVYMQDTDATVLKQIQDALTQG